MAGLKTIILAAQQEGKTVPPGIYAEYGYALYEEGNAAEAIRYFERERDTWPESRVFMEKLIAIARRAASAAARGARLGAREGEAVMMRRLLLVLLAGLGPPLRVRDRPPGASTRSSWRPRPAPS